MNTILHIDNGNPYSSRYPDDYIQGIAEVIARSKVKHTDIDDPCDPTDQVMLVSVNMDDVAQKEQVRKCLWQAFDLGNCGCSHDCCGHRHSSVSSEHLKADLWKITVWTSRNY